MTDPNIIVTNNDIWLDYDIPFYDMLLGGDFEVNTKVNIVKVNIPKNSFEGKVLRITGMGFPIYNTNKYGNLMIKLRTSSVTLSEKQLEHVKKIKDLIDA
jgi:DnaJ-class molecular chaperone